VAEFAESTQLVGSVTSSPGAVHDLRVIEVGASRGEAGQVGDRDWDWFGSSLTSQQPPEVGGCAQEADPQGRPFGVDQRLCSVTRSLTVPSALMSGAMR
jgi:hypothetical protein